MPNEIALPGIAPGGILFSLKEISYSPVAPRLKEPFTVKGKVNLFGIPFLVPVWVIATVTYPQKWWEEIIPLIGAPEVRRSNMALGGDFEVTFEKGFEREGEFSLAVRVYPGPTFPLNSIVFPPAPAVATYETTFGVLGEVPPEEYRFSVGRPNVLPSASVQPGDMITINCPVTSQSTSAEYINVKCLIYEGSVLPLHGDKIVQYLSETTLISPFETKTFSFGHRALSLHTDRRDVEVEVYVGTELVVQDEWDDVYYVAGVPPEEVKFEIIRPTVVPASVMPGDEVDIHCLVTSLSTEEQTATVKCKIYEGSYLPLHGDQITTISSEAFAITPSETREVVFHHTAVSREAERRDVEIEVYVAGKIIKQDEWDDVYYVGAGPEEEVNFSLARPVASPSHVEPGNTVSLTCPITSICTSEVNVRVVVKIYEGTVWVTHGDKLAEHSTSLNISPGQTRNVIISHTAIGTDAERRDVEVETYVDNILIKQGEWDDIFYVAVEPPEEIKFSLSRPSASPSQVPVGSTVAISCPITSQCSKSVSARVKCLVYEGSAWVTHGDLLWTKEQTVTFYPGQTRTVTFSRAAMPGAERRDVEVEVYVGGILIEQNEWDDVYYVKVAVTTVTFAVTIWGTGGFGHYDKWMCYYWDPMVNGFAGDNKWYHPYNDITFTNVAPGGYLAVFLLEDSTMSDQFTSPEFDAVNGGRYQYDLDLGRISKIG